MTTRVIPSSREVFYETSVVIIECARCAIDFGIGADFQKRRREDHGDFYCPNGHANVYRGDNAQEKAEKEAARLRRQLQYANAGAQAARDQAETAERRRRGEKAAKTRLKNRIAKGVCPCCKRSFVNVQRHIAGQHPDFSGSDQ